MVLWIGLEKQQILKVEMFCQREQKEEKNQERKIVYSSNLWQETKL